jgi:hypothetical protein
MDSSSIVQEAKGWKDRYAGKKLAEVPPEAKGISPRAFILWAASRADTSGPKNASAIDARQGPDTDFGVVRKEANELIKGYRRKNDGFDG